MKNFNTRLKNLEKKMFGPDENKIVTFDLRKFPPFFTYKEKTYELSDEEVSKIDKKSLHNLMIKKGLIKKNENKMFVVINWYRGKNNGNKI